MALDWQGVYVQGEAYIVRRQGGHKYRDASQPIDQPGNVYLKGFTGWALAVKLVAKTAFRQSSFGDYLMPYLLATLVIFSGLVSWVP